MDLDEFLVEVGEFGKYQQTVLWLVLLPGVFPCAFHAYNQLFMSAVPEHWCRVPEKENVTKELNIPLEEKDGRMKYSSCYMLNSSEEGVDQEVVPCKYGWRYDTSVYKETVTTEWDLVCENDFLPTLALVLLGIGGLIGNYVFGYLQDGLGRKPSFFVYLFIQCVFGIATAFAQDFVTWAIFRVGVGFTVPAILATPYVLAVELVGPNHRTLVTILVNIAYSLALVCLSLVVWLVRDWRTLALVTTLPFLLFFSYWWTMPESPRWLLAQGRYKEAEDVLTKMARINGKPPPALTLGRLRALVPPGPSDRRLGVADLFRLPNLRVKTLIVTLIWFTNTSVYVGLSYYAPSLGGDEFLNFFLAGAVELPTYLFLWPAMERWGRRWSLCVSMAVGGSACLATFLVKDDSLVTLGLYCIGKMGISSSFVVLPLMASELYPTVVRGLGMNISSMVGMLGPVFIPLVNYLGTDMLTLPLIIMGAMLIVGGACSLLLPETLNRHLPQTLQDAEETRVDCYACCVPPQKIEKGADEGETTV